MIAISATTPPIAGNNQAIAFLFSFRGGIFIGDRDISSDDWVIGLVGSESIMPPSGAGVCIAGCETASDLCSWTGNIGLVGGSEPIISSNGTGAGLK